MTVNAQTFVAKPQPSLFNDQDEHYFVNIHNDKRVYRGSNYAPRGFGEDFDGASPNRSTRRRLKKKEINPFDVERPEPERIPVDLTAHLTEMKPPPLTATRSNQTDHFVPKPKDPEYVPKRTGIDVATDTPNLFDFDTEVEPLLEILVQKTIDQATMEVEEEIEMDDMRIIKETWIENKHIEKRMQDELVDAERARDEARRNLLAESRKKNYNEVLKKKILSCAVSKFFLGGLCKNGLLNFFEEKGFIDTSSVARGGSSSSSSSSKTTRENVEISSLISNDLELQRDIDLILLPEVMKKAKGEIENLKKLEKDVREVFAAGNKAS